MQVRPAADPGQLPALAQQVADVLAPLGERVGVSVATVYGGAPLGRQIDRLRRGVDIVVVDSVAALVDEVRAYSRKLRAKRP